MKFERQEISLNIFITQNMYIQNSCLQYIQSISDIALIKED